VGSKCKDRSTVEINQDRWFGFNWWSKGNNANGTRGVPHDQEKMNDPGLR
jgi:hypothetical protein